MTCHCYCIATYVSKPPCTPALYAVALSRTGVRGESRTVTKEEDKWSPMTSPRTGNPAPKNLKCRNNASILFIVQLAKSAPAVANQYTHREIIVLGHTYLGDVQLWLDFKIWMQWSKGVTEIVPTHTGIYSMCICTHTQREEHIHYSYHGARFLRSLVNHGGACGTCCRCRYFANLTLKKHTPLRVATMYMLVQ